MAKKDVKIVEKENNTEIEILPFNFIIQFNGDSIQMFVKGNTNMHVDGDFNLGIDGEFSVISNNNPIHLDSINSNIYLNSRQSKILKDLPESIEYRKKQKENMQIKELNLHNDDLKERIKKVEKELEELKCRVLQE